MQLLVVRNKRLIPQNEEANVLCLRGGGESNIADTVDSVNVNNFYVLLQLMSLVI